jgi:integrase
MQRLAFELLLWTSRRLSDVRLIGPQHIEQRNGDRYIAFRQVKAQTEEKHCSLIPAELQEVIEMTPQRGLVFVSTAAGSRFASDKSFGNFLARAIRGAGIEGVTPHGLRATAATAVADALGTVHQIKALTGHKSDAMAKKYTERANRRSLGKSAVEQMAPLIGNKTRTEI